MKANFQNISYDNHRIDIRAEFTDKGVLDLWFEASENWDIDGDIVAIECTTLCEKYYDEIYFDLCCSTETIEYIPKYTRADVRCRELTSSISDKKLENWQNSMLNFSGAMIVWRNIACCQKMWH